MKSLMASFNTFTTQTQPDVVIRYSTVHYSTVQYSTVQPDVVIREVSLVLRMLEPLAATIAANTPDTCAGLATSDTPSPRAASLNR